MKLLLSTALALSLASSLFAEDKASITADGLGDLLIAPAYIAEGKTCSKMTVMNVYDDKSILLKASIREQTQSNEVDVPIFLSPGDVWSAEICDVNGKATLKSCDDSNHPEIADKMCNTGIDLLAHSLAAQNEGDFHQGYVEFIPVAQYNEGTKAKVDKNLLVARWDALIDGKTNDPKLNKDKHGVYGFGLSGIITIDDSEMPMVAFKGTTDKPLYGQNINYGRDAVAEILLGKEKVKEIFNLLSKNSIYVPYTNGGKGQYLYTTFLFDGNSDQSRSYDIEIRDRSENKDAEKIERHFISPEPKKVKLVNEVEHELGVISLEDIIKASSNPAMFENGVITIKNLVNHHKGQLGSGNKASFIATKISVDPTTEKVTSWSALPTK